MAAQFLKTHGIDLQDEMTKAQASDASMTLPQHESSISRQTVREVRGVRLAGRNPDLRWDVSIGDEGITSVAPYDPQRAPSSGVLDGRDSLLAPSLCHPHIHLDKCFLLYHPKYADLAIEKGDFAEALALTSEAKARFAHDDLERRGSWLVEESVAAGVTCMRAFVEVDSTVRFKCLDVGLMLKERYRDVCEIQICAFAQDPVFSGGNAAEGQSMMEEALQREGVDVVGSTPYVEASEDLMRRNIDWAIEMAMRYGKHLDLHLDYNLDGAKEPMVNYLVAALHKRQWTLGNKDKRIVLGHCTRLTLFTQDRWRDLRASINDLPISFVGLPTSDLFMMGKPSDSEGGGERVRGTLQIPQMIQQYGFEGAIGVNNVGNAFTPQGSCDPLRIASMGVGIYQAGTKRDAICLYEMVSNRAKVAIGCGKHRVESVLYRTESLGGRRGRPTLQEIVYDPPQGRVALYKGHYHESEISRFSHEIDLKLEYNVC
ncbi:MAG: hypothetical protein LQ345_002458 [Seirophora villosa]|nr:MAG: hypothetical protein LQ345_002458 [Seirophora villosa]